MTMNGRMHVHGAAALLVLICLGVAPARADPRVNAARKPWPGFQVIMWQTKTARQYKALREIGVTAARVQIDRQGETAADARRKVLPISDAGLRIYVENIATDFYSAYHRWFPDKPKNWKFLALKSALARDPTDRGVFVRHPGLSDPRAIAKVARRLKQAVRIYAPYRPLFFDLGDETGIADLSAAWDFGFSRSSLRAMRVWLRRRYGSLAALNHEWGTAFPRWSDVTPPTTTEAMAQEDGNYSSWSDFKAWMDIAFARAVGDGSDAVHAAAPWARSGIEGAQMPGWGGYNYRRLANSVDVMEIYDAANDLAIARSFNPHLIFLTTSRWAGPDAQYQAWREFLRGTRGMVLWDPNNGFVTPNGTIGSRGRAAAGFFRAVNGPLGRMLMRSRRRWSRIAVLYSPASFRIQWMLDHRAMGADWTALGAAAEDGDDAVRAARRRVLEDLSQLGFAPRFVSDSQIARGILHRAGYRMIVLPQAIALSRRAAIAIKAFVRRGGVLAAVGTTGRFDGHGRRLKVPLLSRLLKSNNARIATLPRSAPGAIRDLMRLLKAGGLHAAVRVENTAGGTLPRVRQYVFRNGPLTIAALLAAPVAIRNSAVPVELIVRHRWYAYDAGTGRFLGRSRRLATKAGSDAPTVVVFAPRPLSRRARNVFLGLQDRRVLRNPPRALR